MENKRLLEDIPTEKLLLKLRRANGSLTKAFSEEIIYRQMFPEYVLNLKFDGKGNPIELIKEDEHDFDFLKGKGLL